MKEPDFPSKLRIVIEPKGSPGFGRPGFGWYICGYAEEGSVWREGWLNYDLCWSENGLGNGHGWEKTEKKAESKARKALEEICADQCREKARYKKWLAGYVTIDVDCDGCTD